MPLATVWAISTARAPRKVRADIRASASHHAAFASASTRRRAKHFRLFSPCWAARAEAKRLLARHIRTTTPQSFLSLGHRQFRGALKQMTIIYIFGDARAPSEAPIYIDIDSDDIFFSHFVIRNYSLEAPRPFGFCSGVSPQRTPLPAPI